MPGGPPAPAILRGFHKGRNPSLIVPCSQCHTRFKVPDHKVTARGTKVRCSRCGHTFRIFPEPPAPAAGDPFAAFGPKGTSEMEKTPSRGHTVAELLAQMQPPAAADDFDVDDSGEAAPLPEPAWSFPPAPAPREDGAAAGTAAAAEAEEPDPVTAPMPVGLLPEAAAVEAVVPRTHLAELEMLPEPLRSHPPPFGSAKDLASLAGFTPAWGVAAPVRALDADGTVSPHQSRLDLPPPPPEPVVPREPIGEPLPPEPAGALGPVGTVLDDLPSLEDLPGSPDESLQLDLNPAGSAWPGAAPLGHAATVFELPAGSGSVELDQPRLPPPPPAEPPPLPASPAQSSAPAALEWDAPFAPALPAPAAPPPPSEFGDPFAEPLSASPGAQSTVPLDDPQLIAPTQDHDLFEMGRPGPPPAAVDLGPLLPEIPDSEPAAPVPGSSPTGSITGQFTLGRLSRPPSRIRLGLDDRGEPGAARRVSGFLLNVGIAALLLVVLAALGSGYLSEGRMEWSMLSPRRWLQAFRPPSGVSPTDVTNGTYETRSGRSLVYVRGKVLNRGEPETRVRVEAELWDGGRRVKTSDTVAGASASPEELWMAGTPAEVESLRQKLLAHAHGIPSGGGADFLVLFDEVPPELGSLRLRVVTSVDRH